MAEQAASKAGEGDALRRTARRWLQRINDAERAEKHWRDDAALAVKAYTGESGHTEGGTAEPGTAYDFNVLFANVETIVPAVINSPPAPDIRRRFGSDDPVAKDFAEILERAMRVQVDDGRLQVEMEAMAQDAFLAGRGLIRVRFQADEDAKVPEPEPEEDDPAEDDEPEAVAEPTGERITFEAVPWKDFRRGAAKRWQDVPWIAFRHFMEREDVEAFQDGPLVTSQNEASDPNEDDDDADRVVWEVWDKRTRTTFFIGEKNDGRMLKRIPDPLGLSNFFPIATPVQPIEINGRLMPVNPFSIYRRLADELDTTTKRIRVITRQLKVKGWYGFDPASLAAVLDADDNEFVAIKDAEVWAANGGLTNAVIFWPVEKLIVVLMELYKLRSETKQAIYEITGISDIVRGASAATETATAQQIKTQWGSLRIQKMQRMMERAARDVFLMMAEIIPAKFSPQTLTQMTEIQIEPSEADLQPVPTPPLPPLQAGQQPDPQIQQQVEAAQAAEQERKEKLQHLQALQGLMQQKASTYYRIDVETDSTVKADLTRQKAEASEFMAAAGQYFTAVAPLVQQGALPMEVAVEIFASFSRMYNLGKSVEDALDELVAQAKEKAGQPQQPDPAQAAAKAESDAKLQAMQADVQAKQQEGAIKLQAAQTDMEIRARTAEADLAGKMLDQQGKQVELQIKGTELQIKGAELALKRKQLLQPAAPPAASQGPRTDG